MCKNSRALKLFLVRLSLRPGRSCGGLMELCRRSTYMWSGRLIGYCTVLPIGATRTSCRSHLCEYHVLYSISISCYSNIEEERGTAAHTDRLCALIGGWCALDSFGVELHCTFTICLIMQSGCTRVSARAVRIPGVGIDYGEKRRRPEMSSSVMNSQDVSD